MLNFISYIKKIDSPVWTFVIPVSTQNAVPFLDGKDKRVLCQINDKTEFQTALLPDGNSNYFISINKELRNKLDLEEGDEVKIKLTKDESKYGLPLPEEFKELLEQDTEGNAYFHALTPGKQRSLLHLIGKPKSGDIRLQKGLIILNYLKSTQGKLDYKQLNIAFKNNPYS